MTKYRVPSKTQTCTGCQVTQDAEEFWWYPGRRLRKPKCRTCMKAMQRAWRERNPRYYADRYRREQEDTHADTP